MTPDFKNESTLSETLDQLGDNVWQHDFENDITSFAKTIENILGYKNIDNNNSAGLWWSITHPDDKHLLEKNDRLYRTGIINGHSIEYRVFHQDGSVRWIHDRGTVVEKTTDGKIKKVIGTHSDITERKLLEKKLLESEKRFSDLAINVPGVIYQWQENYDGTYEFIYVSPKLKEYFDIEPENMHTLINYLHPDDKKAWRRSIELSKKTGNPWKFEGRLAYTDGKIKWWHGESLITEKNEKGIIFNGIMTDITETKKIQEFLDKKKEHDKKEILQAVIRAQENERQMISYELHDNVNQLLATAKLLNRLINPENDMAKNFVNEVESNIEKAIEELRNISYGLNSGVMNHVGITGAVTDMLDKINLSGNMSLILDDSEWIESPDIDKEIELSIYRIIQSQVSNILKHSNATRAKITLAKKMDKSELVISDNGKGFDINSTRKGLGLINIFNRAELFNGTVHLKAEPAKGCTLTVSFPATQSVSILRKMAAR